MLGFRGLSCTSYNVADNDYDHVNPLKYKQLRALRLVGKPFALKGHIVFDKIIG